MELVCLGGGLVAVVEIDREEQDRGGGGKDQGADQGEAGNVVGVGGFRDQQVDEFIEEQRAGNAKNGQGGEPEPAGAGREGQKERGGQDENCSEEKMMDEMATGIDVADSTEMEGEAEADEGDPHRGENEEYRLFRGRRRRRERIIHGARARIASPGAVGKMAWSAKAGPIKPRAVVLAVRMA